MASAADLIASLDAALDGEQLVTLRRVPAKGVNVDVQIPAKVRDFRPEELVGGINQNDSQVIISPTQIRAKQWPGGTAAQSPPYDVPQWIPRTNDKLLVQGRLRNITFVNPISAGGDVVRIEMVIAG